MAWEDLEADIAEEFSDNRRIGWVDGGFSFFRREVRAPAIRPPKGPPKGPRRHKPHRYRPWEAAWRRGWRARRRFLALLEGRTPHRCQGYWCCNLLNPKVREGAPQRFCNRLCSIRVPLVERQCAAPGCSNAFTTHGRRTTCSNACRQRAWQEKKRRGATSAHSGR